MAERATCLKPWCSEQEPGPFGHLNASVAVVPDEEKGVGEGFSEKCKVKPSKILCLHPRIWIFILRALESL